MRELAGAWTGCRELDSVTRFGARGKIDFLG
jgi:hypothetical protein